VKVTVVQRAGIGLDIECLSPDATVQDLIDGLQWAADSADVVKEFRHWPRPSEGPCFGCTYCCRRFNIFLTIVDAKLLAAHHEVSLGEFLAYATTFEPWKVDRVRIADPQNYCLGERGCNIYAVRPLICRLYICTPYSPLLRQVIAEVNGRGNRALVDYREGHEDGANPFSGKTDYTQVLLREVLDAITWENLSTRHSLSTPSSTQSKE